MCDELAQMTKQYNMMKRMRDMERKENKKLKGKGHEAYIRNITTLKKLKEANEEIEKMKRKDDVSDEVFEGHKKNEKEYIHRNNILQKRNEELEDNFKCFPPWTRTQADSIKKLRKENQELFDELEHIKKENKKFNGYMMDD
tara:strand:+ start:129 stop:554 length:426 start_codon:yes stop_codon:yes gene_type:complete